MPKKSVPIGLFLKERCDRIGAEVEQMFKLHSKFEPTGDQPEAIAKLVDGIKKGDRAQTLLRSYTAVVRHSRWLIL